MLFLLNSFSGITGFAIVEEINRTASSFLGIVLITAGILIFVSHAKYQRYERIATRIYDVLGSKDAYGHYTASISTTESRVAIRWSDVSKREAFK